MKLAWESVFRVLYASGDPRKSRPISLFGTCPKRETVLPPCRKYLSRSCFATARQRRGCGAERPPSSAAGSGGTLRPKRKGRLHAGFPLASFEPVPADIRPCLKTGCNRGIGCRLCFRAETLRLALHGAGGNVLHRVTWFGMFFSDRGPCETLAGQGKTSDSCGHPARRLSQRYPHAAPFSFFHRARRCLSFRQDEKKDRGAESAAAAGGRKRRPLRSAAAPLAVRREAGPPMAFAARRKNRFSFRASTEKRNGS